MVVVAIVAVARVEGGGRSFGEGEDYKLFLTSGSVNLTQWSSLVLGFLRRVVFFEIKWLYICRTDVHFLLLANSSKQKFV